MLYYNTKFRFALPEQSPSDLAGGIIAASSMPAGQLLRRVRKGLRQFPYLTHRLLDPQLYLAGLAKETSPGTVAKLATQQWFGAHDVPDYDSEQHGSMKSYKSSYGPDLVATWQGAPPILEEDILVAVRACVQYQLDLGCRGVILPSPLTSMTSGAYEAETKWLDAGVQISREFRLSVPIYATVALSDSLLRGIDAFRNPLLANITSQIASRAELSGAYVVVEQTTDTGYACTSPDVALSLLVLTDDLARGAGRQVMVNYVGTFGAVMATAGASIWSTGYYRSQRRLRLADYEENMALAQPRYFSFGLAGDVSLEGLPTAIEKGYGRRILEPVNSINESLTRALADGTFPSATPQWQYRANNLTAASAHYLATHSMLAGVMDSMSGDKLVEYMRRWLKRASELAADLAALGFHPPTSDTHHQAAWLRAVEAWLSRRV